MTLADKLERINQVVCTSPLSIPGEPSWPMERDRQENAKAEFARTCRDNLATILTALRSAEPKAPADVSGLVEDLRCVGTWIDHLPLDHTQDHINTIDQAADALAARDAEIAALKRELGEAREMMRRMLPTNMSLNNTRWPDSTTVPLDTTLGELRAIRDFLTRQETPDDQA